MNFAGQVPEWSDSEAPAQKVTGDLPVLPVTGSRPALFHRYFCAPYYKCYFHTKYVFCVWEGGGHTFVISKKACFPKEVHIYFRWRILQVLVGIIVE